MERYDESNEELIDLGMASGETRGIGLGQQDGADERFPVLGIAED